MSFEGFFVLSTWVYVVIALVLTHITIASVTIFLHRHQAHNALDLKPVVSHFFRFWLWLTTGIVTREWVAIHRKHHATCETADDPHSPRQKGIATVLFGGLVLYRREARNQETLAKFGQGTPDDWLERHLYTAHPSLGIALMGLIDVLLFGLPGLVIFGVRMGRRGQRSLTVEPGPDAGIGVQGVLRLVLPGNCPRRRRAALQGRAAGSELREP